MYGDARGSALSLLTKIEATDTDIDPWMFKFLVEGGTALTDRTCLAALASHFS